MPKKLTLTQITERLVYLLAVLLAPGIPLFFLYSQNAAQGLLFKHFLVTGGVLAITSLAIYLSVSKLFLRRRRTLILIALCWAAFWFFHPMGKIIAMGDAGFSQRKTALYLLFFIVLCAFILRRINMSRLAANTTAVMLCLLFAFNFVPVALAVSAGENQRAYNEKTGKLPYEIKTEFNVDPNLSRPNVYWLHMDGMMGFDAVERYFNDPQTTLKNNLAQRGFVINKGARLEASYTRIAVPAMTSPVFYDSYLAAEFARVAKLTRTPRENSLSMSMSEKGFSLADIYPQIEILKAFSDAGYINIGNYNYWVSIIQSKYLHIGLVDNNVTAGDLNTYHEADSAFNNLVEFKNLITDASALSLYFISHRIDNIFERKRPIPDTQPLPLYQETVDKYVTGSDSDDSMAIAVKSMKYAASIQTPHFVYFNNLIAHTDFVRSIFALDEYGNYYKEPLDDPKDVHLYLPQHRYAAKQMIAKIDTIIENDHDAVIILQADHGIHTYDFKTLLEYGYNLEDQLNLNLQVMSAVRIPPQYGKLSQPLDPLDIARYLVNNFVGKGNYDYLYYTKEDIE
jgi:hypothetical protein